ncbi:hypothetical protein AVEN_219432-1 [Araneus ventricosus]|uniref:Pre-C2HC domain-containing protein n=1 Tax=Araneus ventricosus TaxID=182803 RepID=A0A4Y2RQI9_ARAVE|nr:hypothetical protein AVEN_219432-1 [Araneus ventricosus]
MPYAQLKRLSHLQDGWGRCMSLESRAVIGYISRNNRITKATAGLDYYNAKKSSQSPEDVTPPTEFENKYQCLVEEKAKEKPYTVTISLKPQENYKHILKETVEKFPVTENRWLYGYINIEPTSEECRVQFLTLLNNKKAKYLLNESSEDTPIKIEFKGLSEETDTHVIVEELTRRGYTVNRISQMKKLRPLFLLEIKKIGKYMNIYNERDLCYFKTKIETCKRKAKATICFNCAGYYHAARKCHLRPKCIKCGGEHATRDCSIKEKIAEPKCVNCGETMHLSVWKGYKAIPVMPGPATRQPRKTDAQASNKDTREGEKKSPQQEENTTEVIAGLTDIKDSSCLSLRDHKYLIQEFPTIIEAAKKCKQVKTKDHA